jgi:LysR family transcriptional activator of nhaA
MFNFNHLYYFYVTAHLDGVSNASKFLNISQPSLSAQVKNFENEIDRRLFEKRGRRMQLTAEGEHVYAYCRQIFRSAEHLSEYLKSPLRRERRRIRIGVSDQIERPFIADLLGNILQQGTEHNKSLLTVVSGTDSELLKKLRVQEIDLFLNNKSHAGEDLHEIATVEMPVALVIAKDLAKIRGFKRKPSFNEIFRDQKIGLFLPEERLRLRHEVDVFMQQKNLKKEVLLETDILSVIARAVVDGGGCAFLPIPYVYNEVKMGLLLTITPSDGLWAHHLSLISRKQLEYDPLFEEIKNNLLLLNRPI